MWQKELARVVQSDFKKRKLRNPRFSQRAYAKYLSVSSATVSQILGGNLKWNLLPAIGLKILNKLEISTSERKDILHLLGIVERVKSAPMKQENYNLLTNWAYSAVHAGQELPRDQRHPELLAQRFGLKKSKVEAILRELQQLGLLKESADGFETVVSQVEVGDSPSNEMIRKHHLDVTRLSLTALEEIPAEQRNFAAVTFVGNSSKLEKVRKEFRQFEDRLVSLMDYGDENDQVYQLNIALFPLNFRRS